MYRALPTCAALSVDFSGSILSSSGNDRRFARWSDKTAECIWGTVTASLAFLCTCYFWFHLVRRFVALTRARTCAPDKLGASGKASMRAFRDHGSRKVCIQVLCVWLVFPTCRLTRAVACTDGPSTVSVAVAQPRFYYAVTKQAIRLD